MSLHGLSLSQALDVWSDLARAYYGDHPYGSNVAEIYAYRVMPYRPSLHAAVAAGQASWPNGHCPQVADMRARNAGIMVALLFEFAEAFNCKITVQGERFAWEPLCMWMAEQGFDHRWHVRIEPERAP